MLAGVQVQHELRQRALQRSQRAAQQAEAGTGDLGGRFEIQSTQRLAQVHVIARREVEGRRRAPAAHLDVVVLAAPGRHAVVRQVGDFQAIGVKLVLHGLQARFELRQPLADATHLRQQRGGILTAPLGLADGLGHAIALGLQVLGFGLRSLATGFERRQARQVERKATRGQTRRHRLRFTAQQLRVEHRLSP